MIRFENVTKKYPGSPRPALDSLQLEVQRGEFVFLVGASGSGKSSCLQLVLREERPTNGQVFVLGNDLGTIANRKVSYFRRNIGVVFQDFRLLPNKTVFQNVAFSLQVIGKSRGFIREAVPDTLRLVGLEDKADRLPNELSGGEQQRVAIARAVVNKPQILLADEPTGNLDPATSAGIMKILERINAGGTTVLMATHEAGIVDKMRRRVIQLSAGKIVRDEAGGGYGDTGVIPELAPEQVTGAQVAEARRELADATRRAEQETLDNRAAHERATRDAERSPAERAADAGRQPAAEATAGAADEPAAAGEAEPAGEAAPAAEPAWQPIEWEPQAAQDPAPGGGPAPQSAGGSARSAADAETARTLASVSQAEVQPTPADDDAPDIDAHLSLVDNLGLRGSDTTDDDDETNVGPVR